MLKNYFGAKNRGFSGANENLASIKSIAEDYANLAMLTGLD
jgi:hypothetical protein